MTKQKSLIPSAPVTISLTELQSQKLQQLVAQKQAVENGLNELVALISDAHGLTAKDKVEVSADFKTLTVLK